MGDASVPPLAMMAMSSSSTKMQCAAMKTRLEKPRASRWATGVRPRLRAGAAPPIRIRDMHGDAAAAVIAQRHDPGQCLVIQRIGRMRREDRRDQAMAGPVAEPALGAAEPGAPVGRIRRGWFMIVWPIRRAGRPCRRQARVARDRCSCRRRRSCRRRPSRSRPGSRRPRPDRRRPCRAPAAT